MKLYDKIKYNLTNEPRIIPFPHPALSNYINISKGQYHLVGGAGGSGKSAWVDTHYIHNSVDWYRNKGKDEGYKLHIVLRSLERNQENRVYKWIASELYRKHGILIDAMAMANKRQFKHSFDDDIASSIKDATESIESYMEYVTMVDGSDNPTGIWKQMYEVALSKGTLYSYERDQQGNYVLFKRRRKEVKIVHPNECPQASRYQPHYIPDDPNEITIFIVDHILTLQQEAGLSEKQNIDRMSDYLQRARDRFGFMVVAVAQLNRSINDTYRNQKTDIKPQSSDFSGSSKPYHDCDMAAILFDPFNYEKLREGPWVMKEFINDKNHNCYRSYHLVKNTYGADHKYFCYVFHGGLGLFKELPTKAEQQVAFNIKDAINLKPKKDLT